MKIVSSPCRASSTNWPLATSTTLFLPFVLRLSLQYLVQALLAQLRLLLAKRMRRVVTPGSRECYPAARRSRRVRGPYARDEQRRGHA